MAMPAPSFWVERILVVGPPLSTEDGKSTWMQAAGV